MGVGGLLFIIFIIGVVVGGFVGSAITGGGNGLSSPQKKELKDQRLLLKKIESTCITYREDAPNLTDIIRGDIDNHNLKELN